MLPFEVAAVGDNCIDKYLPPFGYSAVGGNAVNVAIHLAKLGLKSTYFGAVGNDADGKRMRDLFADNHLVIDPVRVVPGITAYTDIEISPSGERKFIFEEFGVCRGYRPTSNEVAQLKTLRHVHIGWLDDDGALKQDLVAAGVSVSQDITVNSHIDNLPMAFASAGDAPEDASQLLQQLLAKGCGIAVVTRGALGSIASDGHQIVETGIKKVEVKDTTGAGDTFIAGFIACRLSGGSLQACLNAGRDAAAVTCTHLGGFPQELVMI
ncbi:PfkB family carbohydrate kinase [Agrobacterium vitis]|uniref:PfkB family carbohydrate kinase n=1 Tax=Agrobacterium vitis TaxID=373 RepID=UPI0007617C43|nr:PfkB family carbohydrate kinase [Agrobacterium vitis]KAA3517787.1 fructoselysine 6-kinase [Agrobacterium vitis]NOJ33069.1 fructoselysine 6-kinase [Agrobacterium vitis]RCU53468.1 fructoselysine 6-kinase [Agrobacterium vitis]